MLCTQGRVGQNGPPTFIKEFFLDVDFHCICCNIQTYWEKLNVSCPLYWQVFSSKQQSASAESEEGNQNLSQQPAKRKSGVKMERDPTILREVIFHPKNFPVNLNQWCSRISPILPNSKFSFSVIEKSFVVRLRMNFIFHPVIYTHLYT